MRNILDSQDNFPPATGGRIAGIVAGVLFVFVAVGGIIRSVVLAMSPRAGAKSHFNPDFAWYVQAQNNVELALLFLSLGALFFLLSAFSKLYHPRWLFWISTFAGVCIFQSLYFGFSLSIVLILALLLMHLLRKRAFYLE